MSADILVTAVEGNRQWLDGGAMFGNAPRSVWERWLTPDAQGRIELACRCMLIEAKGKKILCETGIGAFFDPKLADRYGVRETDHRLLANLAQLGIQEPDIDMVILSHLHFDHAGGLLPTYTEIAAGKDRLLFPKAKYVVGKEAFARALKPHPRDRASFIPGMVEKLQTSGRLVIVDAPQLPGEFADTIRFRFSEGHTPGQMHTEIVGTRKSMLFAGDLVPGSAWVHAPITMGYDRYAEQVIDEKVALYQDIAGKPEWLFFTHDPGVAAARVELDAKGKYVPVDALPNMQRFAL